jgi:hypothetical protein
MSCVYEGKDFSDIEKKTGPKVPQRSNRVNEIEFYAKI